MTVRTTKPRPTIRLKDGDAAILIREDLSHESFLPKSRDGSDNMTSAAILGAMLMFTLSDKKMFDFAHKRFLAIASGKAKPVPRFPNKIKNTKKRSK